jgi:flagellar motor switch protein FliM
VLANHPIFDRFQCFIYFTHAKVGGNSYLLRPYIEPLEVHAFISVASVEKIQGFMSDEELITAMRRKAGAGRAAPDVTGMSSAKALRLAVAKAAEDGTGMVMQVTDVKEVPTSVTRLPDEVPEHSLLGLLEGPAGAYGLAIFSLQVTASVVEQLTTGTVLKFEPEVRNPTSTDAVMCFEFMDQILKNFETIVSEAPNPPDISGYRTTAQLKETRSIPIAFDDIVYRMYRLTVDMGRGVRQGEIFLVFPQERPKPKLKVGVVSEWETQFQASVLETQANLEAILYRVSMPLSQVSELAVGMDILIPSKALQKLEVIADGQKIATAKLGQMNGLRAVRINEHGQDQDNESLGQNEAFGSPMDTTMNSDFPEIAPAFGALDDGGGLPTGFPAMGAEGMGELPELPSLPDLPNELPPLGDISTDLPSLDDMAMGLGDLPPLE